jgi:predicted regulator of Ras-like GTPase activity (Roadblock/LC7/MglB family)
MKPLLQSSTVASADSNRLQGHPPKAKGTAKKIHTWLGGLLKRPAAVTHPPATPPEAIPAASVASVASVARQVTPTVVNDELRLPLAMLVAALPRELHRLIKSDQTAGAVVPLPMQKILSQLGQGSVRFTFGEIRQITPEAFTGKSEHDHILITFPLKELVGWIGPAMLQRRSQKKVKVPEDIASPFAENGKSPAAAPEVPQNALASPPADQLASATDQVIQAYSSGDVAQLPQSQSPGPHSFPPCEPRSGTPVSAPPEPTRLALPVPLLAINGKNLVTAGSSPKTDASPAPIPMRLVPEPEQNPILTPATPPSASTIIPPEEKIVRFISNERTAVPLAEQPLEIKFPKLLEDNGVPATGVETAETATSAVPLSSSSVVLKNVTATPSNSTTESQAELLTPAVFAPPDADRLVMPLATISKDWPGALKTEMADWDLNDAKVLLPMSEVAAGLKRGKLLFGWKQLRSCIRPMPPGHDSRHDDVAVELPLSAVALTFFARQQKKSSPPDPKNVSTATEISDLFHCPTMPGKDNIIVSEPKPVVIETQVSENKDQLPEATPEEVVAAAARLKGVVGALVALPDGLRVASQLDSSLDGDVLAAMLPEAYATMRAWTKEMRLGELSELNFSAGKKTWSIMRVNGLFFAAFGHAGTQLPGDELGQLAAKLNCWEGK